MTERDTERLGGEPEGPKPTGVMAALGRGTSALLGPVGRALRTESATPQDADDDARRYDLTQRMVMAGTMATTAARDAIEAVKSLRAAGYESAEIESLRAKLAACEAAARGAPALPPDHPAWSTACQAVQELRAQLPPGDGERKADHDE